jgi:hypothetical protein
LQLAIIAFFKKKKKKKLLIFCTLQIWRANVEREKYEKKKNTTMFYGLVACVDLQESDDELVLRYIEDMKQQF